MFENLLNLVKENAGDAIINNADIPNEHNEAAVHTTATSIMDHLKNISSGGGIDNIMSMFTGGNTENNETVKGIGNNVANQLMSQFGLNADQAGSAIKQLIPKVMSQLVHKTNDPNDKSFDLQSIIGSLTGGSTGGIGGIMDSMKKLF